MELFAVSPLKKSTTVKSRFSKHLIEVQHDEFGCPEAPTKPSLPPGLTHPHHLPKSPRATKSEVYGLPESMHRCYIHLKHQFCIPRGKPVFHEEIGCPDWCGSVGWEFVPQT